MCSLGYNIPAEAQTSPYGQGCNHCPMSEELQQKMIKERVVEASHRAERGNQNMGS